MYQLVLQWTTELEDDDDVLVALKGTLEGSVPVEAGDVDGHDLGWAR